MLDKEFLTHLCYEIQEMLLKKNSDYGNSYFDLRKEFGKITFVIRLSDKINRLKSLIKKQTSEISETEEDTIKDIIGYCLLELYYRKHKDINI